MQVSIKFDTEKESIDELQSLIASLQDLVEKKKNGQLPASTISSVPEDTSTTSQSQALPPTQPVQTPATQPAQTPDPQRGQGSAAQIVDYDPEMEKKFSDIFSGKSGA